MYKKRILIILIFFILTAAEKTWAQEEKTAEYLRWVAIDGASSYLVEIIKSDKEVLKTETENNYIPLFLVPGDYTYNITVFNKFRRKMAESGWRPLRIEESAEPLISAFSPDFFYLDKETIVVDFTAYNISDKSSVYLVDSSSGRQYPGNLNFISNYKYSADFEADNLEEGFYNLGIINESGLSFISSDQLTLKIPVKPEISAVDRESLFIGLISSLRLAGSNFEKGINVELRDNSNVITPVSLFYESEEKLIVIADLSNAVMGEYVITVKNPSGLFSEYPNKIILTEIPEQAISEPVITEPETLFYTVKKDYFTVHGGLSYGYSLDNYPDYHNYNYLGYTLRLQFDFNNSFFNRFFWLAPFGAEIQADYYPKDIYFHEIGANIYYKSRFDPPFNFILRGGGGVSLFSKEMSGPESGRYIQGTAGIIVSLLKIIYLDLSFGPKVWVVERDYYNYVISTATAGITF